MPIERFFTSSIELCIETWSVRPDFEVSIVPAFSQWPVCSIIRIVVNKATWRVLSSVSKELARQNKTLSIPCTIRTTKAKGNLNIKTLYRKGVWIWKVRAKCSKNVFRFDTNCCIKANILQRPLQKLVAIKLEKLEWKKHLLKYLVAHGDNNFGYDVTI